MIKIEKVNTKSQLKKFVKFPLKLYKDNDKFVPTLISDDYTTLNKDKNGAFEYCDSKYFLAYKDDELVGRIAAIINNKYIIKWGQKNGRFAFVDFIEDFEVAKALFEKAEEWLKQNGMQGIQGPLAFCDMDPEGMLVEGFDVPGNMTTIYNHAYYPEYLEKLGYVKDADWFEYKITLPDEIPEIIIKITDRAMKRYNLKFVEFKSKRQIKKYGEKLFELLNISYTQLYGQTDLNERQIKDFINQYFSFINENCIRLMTNEEDELIAFGVGMPSMTKAMQRTKGKLLPFGFIYLLRNLNKKHHEVYDLLLMAVRPDYQAKGINAVMLNEMLKQAKKLNIKQVECNPVLEENTKMRTQWRYFNPQQTKTRRSYFKKMS